MNSVRELNTSQCTCSETPIQDINETLVQHSCERSIFMKPRTLQLMSIKK